MHKRLGSRGYLLGERWGGWSKILVLNHLRMCFRNIAGASFFALPKVLAGSSISCMTRFVRVGIGWLGCLYVQHMGILRQWLLPRGFGSCDDQLRTWCIFGRSYRLICFVWASSWDWEMGARRNESVHTSNGKLLEIICTWPRNYECLKSEYEEWVNWMTGKAKEWVLTNF